MTSSVMFGKMGVNSPAPKRASLTTARQPSPQPAQTPAPSSPDNLEFNGDNLNELDLSFGRKSEYIAQDKSMIMAIVLWLFIGGVGSHRFYLGHKFVGLALVVTGIIAWGSLFGSGVTAAVDTFAKHDMNMASLISTVGFVIVHSTWTFFDMFYIGIRKLINTYA